MSGTGMFDLPDTRTSRAMCWFLSPGTRIVSRDHHPPSAGERASPEVPCRKHVFTRFGSLELKKHEFGRYLKGNVWVRDRM